MGQFSPGAQFVIEDDSRDVNDLDSLETSQDALANKAIAEYLRAVDAGKPLDAKAWLAQYREVRPALLEFLDDQRETGNDLGDGKFQGLIDEVRPVEMDATTDFSNLASAPASETPSIRGGQRMSGSSAKPQTVADIRLGRLLGVGGMGHVFEGVDASGQSVAVKLLSPSWSRSTESIERFKQEGAIASTINHPRCVFVRAADTDNGCPYIVMELMSGETLKDLVVKRGQIPFQESLRLLLDLAEGLEEAHSHGLIHRDVKPANCYLEGTDRVKVGDFGLARSIVSPSDLTSSGGFLGTPLYASPEQIRGEVLDGRTDIYSLCATLYYLLTGQAPFAADSPTKTIARIVSEDPKSVREYVSDIPLAVDRLVSKGLSRDRSLRFQTMSELIAAIRPLIHNQMLAVTYGKRIAATAIDVGIYSTITWAFIFSIAPQLFISGHKNQWLFYGVLPLIFAYFLLFEKLKGATPGKQLFKMKVVDCENLESASWRSVIIRTAIFVSLIGYGSDAVLKAIGYTEPSAMTFALTAVGYVVGYGLMFVTVGRRADRPLVQDWFSGTRVIERIDAGRDQFSAALKPKRLVVRTADDLTPPAFGRFKTTGRIGRDTFLAEDVSLGRKVWVVLRNERHLADAPSGSIHLDRTTRLRHVQSGTIAQGNWDAYLAIDGAPLTQWVDRDHPLPWKDTRAILKQYCDEMVQSQHDGSTPTILSINQIWLDTRGRLVVLDPWLDIFNDAENNEIVVSPGNGNGSTLDPLEVANQIASIALSGRPHRAGNGLLEAASKSRTPVVERPLPMHARKLVDRLAGATLPAYESIDVLRSDLAASETLATKVESKHRMVQVLLTLLLMAPVFGATLSLIRLGNQVGVQVAFDAIAGGEVLRRIAVDDERFESFVAGWSKDHGQPPSREDLPKIADAIDQQCIDIFQARLGGAGTIQKTLLTANQIDERIIDRRESFNFKVEDNADGSIKEYRLSATTTSSKGFTGSPEWLGRLINNAKEGEAMVIQRPFRVYLLGLATLIASTFWKVLFRGGWSAWIAGIRYVDISGKSASFFRHLVRSIALHMPLFIIALSIITTDLWFPQYLWVSNILFGLGVITAIIISIVVMLRPRGCLHDRIAGTYPVPR